jgi:hypothetical protein
MLDIFPELKDSTNIIFLEPSKKGLKRFRHSGNVPEPLESPMFAHLSLSSRIHQHVREVADLSLRKVPALSFKFTTLDQARDELTRKEMYRQQSLIYVSKCKSWAQCRLLLMKELVPNEQFIQLPRHARIEQFNTKSASMDEEAQKRLPAVEFGRKRFASTGDVFSAELTASLLDGSASYSLQRVASHSIAVSGTPNGFTLSQALPTLRNRKLSESYSRDAAKELASLKKMESRASKPLERCPEN